MKEYPESSLSVLQLYISGLGIWALCNNKDQVEKLINKTNIHGHRQDQEDILLFFIIVISSGSTRSSQKTMWIP